MPIGLTIPDEIIGCGCDAEEMPAGITGASALTVPGFQAEIPAAIIESSALTVPLMSSSIFYQILQIF